MKITPQAIAGALLAMQATAFAYNEDGHFYTVVALEQERRDLANLPADHFRIVALCAQIPDLSRELDAVTLKVNSLGALGGWLWGGFGACRNDEVRHMVSVHHYVHALTDGDAKRTEAAANETVTKLRAIWSSDPTYVNACALGLGLHLLGDSQSHRRLGTDSQMYGPGMGHANDNHDPDYIVFRDRLPLWKRYVGTLGNIHLIQEEKVHRGEMFKIFDTRLTGGSRENSYFTPTIIEEMKRLQTPTGGHALSPFERARPVEKYYEQSSGIGRFVLDRGFDEVAKDYAPVADVKFDKVWRAYLAVVRDTFKELPPSCEPPRAYR